VLRRCASHPRTIRATHDAAPAAVPAGSKEVAALRGETVAVDGILLVLQLSTNFHEECGWREPPGPVPATTSMAPQRDKAERTVRQLAPRCTRPLRAWPKQLAERCKSAG
jgi:hypothetical protein